MKQLDIRVYQASSVPVGTPCLVVGTMRDDGRWRLRPAELIFSDTETGEETLVQMQFSGDYACSA